MGGASEEQTKKIFEHKNFNPYDMSEKRRQDKLMQDSFNISKRKMDKQVAMRESVD